MLISGCVRLLRQPFCNADQEAVFHVKYSSFQES